jgi:hypothetical protein
MFSLPFSSDEFFGVFAAYNQRFVLVAVVFWLVTLLSVVAAWRDSRCWSRRLGALLAVMWLWNAVGYHALLFSAINSAAWLFAALFTLQAALFAVATARGRVDYFGAIGARSVIGAGLVAYALVYPALAFASGHPYPEVPTFGVPCPTAILTIGLLVSAGGRPPLTLSIVPIVWAFIGGSAALLFGVVPDYVLLATGVMLFTILIGKRR